MKSTDFKYTMPRSFILVFFVFSISVVTGGYLYYKSQSRNIILEKQSELAAISTLKTEEIADWRIEHLSDGNLIINNSALINQISDYLLRKQSVDKDQILLWMQSLLRNKDYQGVVLVDNSNTIRLSFPLTDTILGKIPEAALTEVIENNQVLLTDLHR